MADLTPDELLGLARIAKLNIPGEDLEPLTMRFNASTAVVEAARTGQRIEFDVSVRDGVNEITAIRPE